jgi:hypothetical protein
MVWGGPKPVGVCERLETKRVELACAMSRVLTKPARFGEGVAALDLSEARSYPLPVGRYLLRWRSASQAGDYAKQIVTVEPRDVTTVTLD